MASSSADQLLSRQTALAKLPGVDRLAGEPALADAVAACGRQLVVAALRELLAEVRADYLAGRIEALPDTPTLAAHAQGRLLRHGLRGPRPVCNLTGTVIHTNLGRAPLPTEAIEALALAAGACDVEFDLQTGERGERDHHAEALLCTLTGAEAATVVNNTAAAVLLVLNTFAMGREVPVSRGELVEIGGAFRMPEIMRRAGAHLVEVGTTNRTHPADFEAALGPDTGLVMKVHPSNYAIEGFTSEVDIRALAELTAARGIPLAYDLGSGSLVDLARFGLAREPMPGDALRQGADLVMFSGDKLLGGPQAGIIVGKRAAVEAVRRNPLKRALRVDKLILAALAATLRLYAQPDVLPDAVPVLRLLQRPLADIDAAASGAREALSQALGERWQIEVIDLRSQIGSGSLPVATLDSRGVALAPTAETSHGTRLQALAERLRRLPTPVVGRIQDDRLLLDCRCLEDVEAFAANLSSLQPEA